MEYHRLSNDYFKASNHRVLINKEERISIPFFLKPCFDFDLNPKFLNINEKPLYKINSYEEFLNHSIKETFEYFFTSKALIDL